MSKSTLSSVVSNLVRAQMGASVEPTITDDDLDRHVAELILKEAKQKAERYGKDGIRAYLARNIDSNAPKTNKRFLSSIIRNTDDHNKSILRAQAQAAQEARMEREEQERQERRMRAEEAVEAARLRQRRGDDRDWADNWERDRKRRHRSWERDDRDDDRHHRSETRERRRRHRSRSPEEDKESRRHRRSKRSRSRSPGRSSRRHEDHEDREHRRHRRGKKRSRSPDDEEEERRRRKQRERSRDRSHCPRRSDPSPSDSLRAPSEGEASQQHARTQSPAGPSSPRSSYSGDPAERQDSAPDPDTTMNREDELRAQLRRKSKAKAQAERSPSPPPPAPEHRRSHSRTPISSHRSSRTRRSPSCSRSPKRSHKSSRRNHRHASRTPLRDLTPTPTRSRSLSPRRERRRHKSSRSAAPSKPGSSSSQTLRSSRTPSHSHSRSRSPGPPAPPTAAAGSSLPSKMDKYFEASYDPRLDVAPLSLPTIPATGMISDAEFAGWDAMLEIIKLRRQDKEDKKVLERWGGSKEKEKDKSVDKGGEVSALDIKYKKRGSVREWDLGKEGF